MGIINVFVTESAYPPTPHTSDSKSKMSFSSTPSIGSAFQDIYNSPHYSGVGSGSGSGSGNQSGNHLSGSQSTNYNPPQFPASTVTTINTSVAPSVRQRLIELLHPFRGDFISFVATEARVHERKVLTLAGKSIS